MVVCEDPDTKPKPTKDGNDADGVYRCGLRARGPSNVVANVFRRVGRECRSTAFIQLAARSEPSVEERAPKEVSTKPRVSLQLTLTWDCARFRKTAPMLQHSPEVEDAVNQLLEADDRAMQVVLKVSPSVCGLVGRIAQGLTSTALDEHGARDTVCCQ
jgi:hypothetical protein